MQNSSAMTSSPDTIEPISLMDLWNTILRRRFIIAVTVGIFLVLGFLAFQLTPREYSAKAVLLLANQQRDIQIKAVLTAEPNDDMLIPSEIQVLQSRDLMGKVVDKLGVVSNPSLIFSAKPEKLDANAKPAPMSKEAQADHRNRIIDFALSQLKVRQIEKSRAIEVIYEARNPKIAADIVNTLTNLYIEQQLSANFDIIRMTNEWLSDRVRETRQQVQDADRKVAEYRQKAGIIDSRGIDLIEQDITELSNKLTAAKAYAAETESKLSSVEQKDQMETLPEVLDAPLIQNLRGREAEARDELAALENQLGPSHPKVTTARAQVSEISGKIRNEIGKLAEGLRRENEAALKSVANIEKELDLLKEEYNKYKSENVELASLESEAATYHSFLETLNLRLKETQSQEDNKFQTPYARIISPAPVPEWPSKPNGKLIMAASLLAGLCLGIGLALGLDMVQSGIYNGKQIQLLTRKTNIAVVPKVALDPAKGLISYADFPVKMPFSPYMQGIRALSMFIRLEHSKNPAAKIFNVTSSREGEGKSAIVVSLARQLALEGMKVLAVDCDVRQPTLTNTFGIMQKPGLNEILTGKNNFADVLHRDAETGATFMGVGRFDDLNVMSLGLEEWKSLLDGFSAQYDVVLLDSPPVVSFPESRMLAKLSRNILCVRWRKTSTKLLSYALDTMERLDCNILGPIFTLSENKQAFVQDSYRS